MTEQHARALFLLAGFDVTSLHQLPNGYWPDNEHYTDIRRKNPWWLAITTLGPIKVGWRKHVINIEWRDTPLRAKIHEDANVTSEEWFCHAWSWVKALEYMTNLRAALGATEGGA